jgi:hypothetical protein
LKLAVGSDYVPFAAIIVAAGEQGRAKLFLLAPCRLKAAGLCVPGAGKVVRYISAAGAVQADSWLLLSTRLGWLFLPH